MPDLKIWCCTKFKDAATGVSGFVGGGLLYPATMRPDAQIEQGSDGTWNVYGCCGGGCYVMTNLKFCPFCGSELPKENVYED